MISSIADEVFGSGCTSSSSTGGTRLQENKNNNNMLKILFKASANVKQIYLDYCFIQNKSKFAQVFKGN
jgi:hypothetical protein